MQRYSLREEIASATTHGLGATLAIGGLAYMLCVGFYKWRSLPYAHAVWHGFVLAGAALHYFAVLFYLTLDA